MNQSEQRNTFIFRIAALLLLGVLLTMRLFAGVPARYTTNAQGSDGARVARHVLTVTPTTNTQNLVMTHTRGGTTSANYSFTVSNQNAQGQLCEVKMSYKIMVSLPSPLVSGMTLKMDGKNADIISTDQKTYVFYCPTVFEAAQQNQVSHTLTFTVTSDFDNFNYVDIGQVALSVPGLTSYYYLDGMQVDAISEQID